MKDLLESLNDGAVIEVSDPHNNREWLCYFDAKDGGYNTLERVNGVARSWGFFPLVAMGDTKMLQELQSWESKGYTFSIATLLPSTIKGMW